MRLVIRTLPAASERGPHAGPYPHRRGVPIGRGGRAQLRHAGLLQLGPGQRQAQGNGAD